MRKYTNRELAQLYDKKDWGTLWTIVTPMVKHSVRRCMQEGLDPFYVRDDLMQEAYLAAWKAIPKWLAFEAGLQTWIRENVRIALTDANRRQVSGMVGGRDSGGYVVSIHGESPDADGSADDEQGGVWGIEAALTYAEPPLDLADPADELYLLVIPPKYRDMVRRLAGIGAPQETQAEYAAAAGVSVSTVELRLRQLRKYLKGKELKPANQVTGAIDI